MKYALYVGEDYDSPESSLPDGYSDDVEQLKVQAASRLEEWYEIVDISEQPFKAVEAGRIEHLKQELCKHPVKHRVSDPDFGGLIVSGALAQAGLYCSVCGKRVGD